ncbi:MAG: hypothetical protein IPG50_16200 [Myxococcales bacterium]|nr:hypothetical protein [Myxococcales bacterium]
MKRTFSVPVVPSVVVLGALCLGCSAEGRDVTASPAPSSSQAPVGPGTTGTPSGIGSNDGGVVTKEPKSEVYGHSGTELYRLDPITKAVTRVGDFKSCGTTGGVIDIALDEDSNLFASTAQALFRVDPDTAKCTKIADGDYPNSLSFVPKGTVDANAEALVGYDKDDYVRIDPQTGKRSIIGSLGQGYTSSGDIVSVKGGGTYLTVKGNSCDDCIVEVDPATGALKKKLGSLGHADVFGLAYWAGNAYGFDKSGNLFEVDLTASKVTTKSIPLPKAPADLSFWGAGSTTSAPVSGPK